MGNSKADWKMYLPKAYYAEDPRAIIIEFPFAIVVTVDPQGLPYSTQTPVYFETDAEDETRLIGHFARSNPHAQSLTDGMPALAVFPGPHAYISSTWYVDRPTVPTWNYVTAQARGRLEVLDDADDQLAVLNRVIEKAEAYNGSSWTMENAPDGKVEQLLPHIRSFRINIEVLEGATKLSQTHPDEDQARIAKALDTRDKGHDAEIASLVRKRAPLW